MNVPTPDQPIQTKAKLNENEKIQSNRSVLVILVHYVSLFFIFSPFVWIDPHFLFNLFFSASFILLNVDNWYLVQNWCLLTRYIVFIYFVYFFLFRSPFELISCVQTLYAQLFFFFVYDVILFAFEKETVDLDMEKNYYHVNKTCIVSLKERKRKKCALQQPIILTQKLIKFQWKYQNNTTANCLCLWADIKIEFHV